MPPLLEWGEEIDFSCLCVCVAEAVFLNSLLLTLYSVVVVFDVFVVVVVFDVDVSESPGDRNFFWLLLVQWGRPPESRFLEFLQRPGEDGCGEDGG